ncbi:MAG: hypothetical protein KKB79_03525 [Nanoarchaeota archaeon]|nr:hypothetical protein [Nanoarchaeota archaeon]
MTSENNDKEQPSFREKIKEKISNVHMPDLKFGERLSSVKDGLEGGWASTGKYISEMDVKEKWRSGKRVIGGAGKSVGRACANNKKIILAGVCVAGIGTAGYSFVPWQNLYDEAKSLVPEGEVPEEKVPERFYTGAQADSIVRDTRDDYEGRMGAYQARIDSLNGVIKEKDERNSKDDGELRRVRGELTRANRNSQNLERINNNNNSSALLVRSREKSQRLEAAVTPFLLGSPDSAEVMNTIVSGNAAIYTGEAAKAYDPRAEAGEVYIFETKNGKPVGFGFRLGKK